MKKYLLIDNDNTYLKAYAPGDGALALNCVGFKDPTGDTVPFVASEAEIIELRDRHFKDFGIVKVGQARPLYRFFKPVERLSETELRIEGKDYRFETVFPDRAVDDELQRYRLFTEVKFGDGPAKEVEQENISVKGAASFYLKNEQAVLASYQEFKNDEAHQYSVSGQAKRDLNEKHLAP